MSEAPLCACGCGQQTTRRRKGLLKNGGRKLGRYQKYILHHKKRSVAITAEPNPAGLCMCGCGQRTRLATATRSQAGIILGKPMRYIHGHTGRKPPLYRVDEKSGCWLWFGATTPRGYGQYQYNGKPGYAHRYFYEKKKGCIQKGLELDHLCRTPRCVNPDHLEPVTHEENMRRWRESRRAA